MLTRITSFVLVGGLLIVFSVFSFTTASAQNRPDIGPNRGEMYPDFHLSRLDGTTGRLSDYRGQKVILFQFASW